MKFHYVCSTILFFSVWKIKEKKVFHCTFFLNEKREENCINRSKNCKSAGISALKGNVLSTFCAWKTIWKCGATYCVLFLNVELWMCFSREICLMKLLNFYYYDWNMEKGSLWWSVCWDVKFASTSLIKK